MRTLKHGDRGREVLDIQSRLMSLGFSMGTAGVDGFFGDDTLKAVLQFQQQSGLVADGIVGENTWCELVEARYEPGERLLYLRIPPFRGSDVLLLQRSLNRLGFNAGPEDGIFGPATERGVIEFQENSGLVVDGMVDGSVIKSMARVTKSGEPHENGAKIPDRNGGRPGGRQLAETIIALDAGHGGADAGYLSPAGIPEKDITLQIALALADALENAGARTILTRTGDQEVPLYERPELANSTGADIFLSIHLNSCPSPRAQGAAAYFFSRQGYYSEAGSMLASHVVTSISSKLGVAEIPALGRNYAVLRETTMTAILVEPFFLGSADLQPLKSGGLAGRTAEALFIGIQSYFRA